MLDYKEVFKKDLNIPEGKRLFSFCLKILKGFTLHTTFVLIEKLSKVANYINIL